MTTFLYLANEPEAPWRSAIAKTAPDAAFLVWGEDDVEPETIDYALVWMPPKGVLQTLPNLKGIFNLGAGVDALLADETLPRNVPLIRLVDPLLTSGMTEYIVHWVLHFHRDMPVYAQQQAAKNWTPHAAPLTASRCIGILGLGELGRDAAEKLKGLGFDDMAGWSRTKKAIPGVKSFYGDEQLDAFLSRTDILVNLLPLTDATRNILNARTLAQLPKGASFINAGRGKTVDEEALLNALSDGHVRWAALDVFQDEPLDPDHPFWSHSNVFITPHVASLTVPEAAAPKIKHALDLLERGERPPTQVDLSRGY